MKRRFAGGIAVSRAPWLGASIVALVACGQPSAKPGFQELGGSGGAGSTAQSSTHSSTHATVGQAAVTASSTQASASASAATTSAQSSSSGNGCVDTGLGEPNEDEQSAYNLGDITDCDNTGSKVSGVISSPFDIDWYRYHATDTVGCVVDPTRSLQSSYPIRLCKFAQCDSGLATNVTCPSGTDTATSPVGRPGCCAFQGFTLGLKCGSSSLNSYSATIYLRLDNPQANPCVSYTLAYHF